MGTSLEATPVTASTEGEIGLTGSRRSTRAHPISLQSGSTSGSERRGCQGDGDGAAPLLLLGVLVEEQRWRSC